MSMTASRIRIAQLSACAVLAVVGLAEVRADTSTYIGGDGGFWHDALNWDNGLPNGDFNAIVNNDGSNVLVHVDALTTLRNLAIQADDEVSVNNGRELRMSSFWGSSTINNAGVLRLASSGSHTYLRFEPGTSGDVFVLQGGGELIADTAGPNWMYEIFGDAVLHNLDNTIRGGNLYLGYNSMEVINEANIVSDAGHTIFLDPPSAGLDFGFINSGTLRADGGTLSLGPGDYDNSLGVIEALNGFTVEMNGARIHGGTLRGIAGGEVQVQGTASELDLTATGDSTLEGTIRVANGRELRTYGPGVVYNNDSLLLDSSGSHTYFRFEPDVAGDVVRLEGGGEIVASANGPSWLYELFGDAVLHNVDNTIRGGYLYLGYNAMEVINDGLILSDAGHTISLDPPSDSGAHGFTNNGTIRADTGILRLDPGHYDNRNGVLEALNGSLIELNGAFLHGGTIRADETSIIRVTGSTSTLDLSTGATPTLEGTIQADNGRELRTYGAGTVNNTGTIRIDSTGSHTYFRIEPENDFDVVILTGGGEVIANDAGPCWIYEVHGNAVLHNLDNTIRGGNLYLGYNVIEIINDGTILSDSDAFPIRIDPPVGDTGFDNRGLLQTTGLAGITIQAGTFSNTGTVDVALDSVLTRTGDFDQIGGETIVEGTLSTSATVNLLGGTLSGNGNVDGDVLNDGGVVTPGASAGTLTINGSYVQMTQGTLAVELGGLVPGGQHDVLAVNDDVTLAGTLAIALLDGFEPMLGDQFTILTSTGVIDGQFEFVDCGGLYQVDYYDDAVVVTIIGEPVDGDLNCDGCVDQADLGILLAAYNQTGAGDLDGDGDTDQADLGVLLSFYGNGC